jgi:CBS domain-containing protein
MVILREGYGRNQAIKARLITPETGVSNQGESLLQMNKSTDENDQTAGTSGGQPLRQAEEIADGIDRMIEEGGKDAPEQPNNSVTNAKSAIDQSEELRSKTLKEIVHCKAKTLAPEASVQEACDQLRSEKMTSTPVTDTNGRLLGTVSESELNRKVGGFGHDPKIELAQTELDQETFYCFEDQPIAEAEKLMREKNLNQLPVLTREKRMVGTVTLEDIIKHKERQQE